MGWVAGLSQPSKLRRANPVARTLRRPRRPRRDWSTAGAIQHLHQGVVTADQGSRLGADARGAAADARGYNCDGTRKGGAPKIAERPRPARGPLGTRYFGRSSSREYRTPFRTTNRTRRALVISRVGSASKMARSARLPL